MSEVFNDALHSLKLSEDGSYTAYSKEYDEHYHSTKDGALRESLFKHVLPAMKHAEDLEEIHILDICYGLGFNTLATLYYLQKNQVNKKVCIYSPELDSDLIASLTNFIYPQEFASFKNIIEILSKKKSFENEQIKIELFIGDARDYVKQFKNKFDIVYQDAFSPASNPVLWTKEYFADIADAIKYEGILTTYSTALKTRLALYENGFTIYLNKGEGFRNATLASLCQLKEYELVDMEHKMACNVNVQPLSDKELGVDYR